jgi:hypothetical protein
MNGETVFRGTGLQVFGVYSHNNKLSGNTYMYICVCVCVCVCVCAVYASVHTCIHAKEPDGSCGKDCGFFREVLCWNLDWKADNRDRCFS